MDMAAPGASTAQHELQRALAALTANQEDCKPGTYAKTPPPPHAMGKSIWTGVRRPRQNITRNEMGTTHERYWQLNNKGLCDTYFQRKCNGISQLNIECLHIIVAYLQSMVKLMERQKRCVHTTSPTTGSWTRRKRATRLFVFLK